VLFAITVHEAAHGYVARHFGDGTASFLGRVTLNPLKHIDPIGTIVMPLALYLMTGGAFIFGYAKPVPVNFGQLRNPKRDMVWVALAGPLSNLLMALGWGILLYVLIAAGVDERFFLEMCRGGVLVNVVMFVFNLFPCPRWTAGACWWACCRRARPWPSAASSPGASSSSWRSSSPASSATCGCAR
jgi:Zn-dependent protease